MAAFKRALFGYKRSEVDAAVAACAEQRAATERELLVLSEMLVAREREAETLKQQLADAHARHDRSLRSLEVLAGHLDELHAQARGQATRIRMKALSDAALVTERASEALEAVRHLQQVRANGNGNGLAPAAESAEGAPAEKAATGGASPNGATGGAPAGPFATAGSVAGNGSVDFGGADPNGVTYPVQAAESNPNGEIGYYQGEVEVEIGPLGDFSQLLGFESAAGKIEGASEISVRRFAAGRATLGMRLDEPIELLRELEERSPFEFKVRHTGGRRLVLDIEDQAQD